MGLTAFVLGGGGVLGAAEVGMLQALAEHGIAPGLVIGTSVGAINGAAYAMAPGTEMAQVLVRMWVELDSCGVFGGSVLSQLNTFARTRTHLFDNERLRELLTTHLRASRIEELAVPFQCVAACVERAVGHWFTAGPLIEAVLASCAVPGLLPAVQIGGEHFLDGGLVDSLPVARAITLGACDIYALHVGRLEQPLRAPRWPWEVASTAFEIARRSRFTDAMANLPASVNVHVLPSGATDVPIANLRFRSNRGVRERIERAHEATAEYLSRR
ncbi:MAG TPA: patatin-like phospholipase family protein [Sporichthyaceae bacterium]|nr:patatin-like phospholipase family protein [Sporichthyaceae bacterium]